MFTSLYETLQNGTKQPARKPKNYAHAELFRGKTNRLHGRIVSPYVENARHDF